MLVFRALLEIWRCWFSKIFRLVYSEYWVEKETRSHVFFVNLQLGGGYCPLTVSIIPFLPRCSLGNAPTVGRRTFLCLQNIKTPKIHHQIFESQLFIFVSTVRVKIILPKTKHRNPVEKIIFPTFLGGAIMFHHKPWWGDLWRCWVELPPTKERGWFDLCWGGVVCSF